MMKLILIAILLIISYAGQAQQYDEVDVINIGPNGVTVAETKLSPAQVKAKYKPISTGSCEGFSYTLRRFNNKLYYYLSKDIADQISTVRQDMSKASYFKYYKADKCLVVLFKKDQDVKAVDNCFKKFCKK